MNTSDKMHFEFVVFFIISFGSLALSLHVNVRRESSELSEPRTIEKSFKLMYNLFKMFNSFKSNSQEEKKFSKVQRQMVPYNGLNYELYDDDNRRVTTLDRFPTLAELNKEEEMMNNRVQASTDVKDMKDMTKKEEPQFWLFDKFSKKTDLLLMTKILLKIIIFKKIVKFIALVCLLFFIPALKDENSNTEEKKDGRNLDVYGNNLRSFKGFKGQEGACSGVKKFIF